MSDPDDWDEDGWDIKDDPSFDEAAAEWADKKAEELKAEWAASGLEQTIEKAHETAWPEVQRALARAVQREAEANYDEAAFHLARALEGYLRAVFLNPAAEQLFEPFSDLRNAALIEVFDIVPSSLVGRAPQRLLLFALIGVTGDVDAAKAISSSVSGAFNGGPWKTRNRVAHSLHVPDKGEVAALSARVRKALDTVSAPLVKRLTEKAERAAEAKRLREAQRASIWSFDADSSNEVQPSEPPASTTP